MVHVESLEHCMPDPQHVHEEMRKVSGVTGHGGDGRVPVPAGKSAGEFHEPTQADDVYAFGALMVEMVTGDQPLATLSRGLKYRLP